MAAITQSLNRNFGLNRKDWPSAPDYRRLKEKLRAEAMQSKSEEGGDRVKLGRHSDFPGTVVSLHPGGCRIELRVEDRNNLPKESLGAKANSIQTGLSRSICISDIKGGGFSVIDSISRWATVWEKTDGFDKPFTLGSASQKRKLLVDSDNSVLYEEKKIEPVTLSKLSGFDDIGDYVAGIGEVKDILTHLKS